ncbi:MAG: succinylglutamate desuccinylase/aspartoacylase family protein [Treponema sp.]|nr:succinylglutamate desuccinylase/aspartoacylase family protein [Treponema sp.]
MLTKVIFFLVTVYALSSCSGNPVVSKSVASGGGVTAVRLLSDYAPSLKNTAEDTNVYLLDSSKPGAKLLLVAGTHGDEPAGIQAAEFFIARAEVQQGSVFVIPRLNDAGVAAGSRFVQADWERSDDDDYFTPPEGSTRYAEIEQRNINRSYPGSESGAAAQKIAQAVMRLLVQENIDIAIDMHEARPSSGIARTIIANQKNANAAALAIFDLEERGIIMRLELSPPDMDGLSHKEWGNRTRAAAFLIETENPAYGSNSAIGVPGDPRYAVDKRTAIQLEAVKAIVRRCNETLPAPLVFSGIPVYTE